MEWGRESIDKFLQTLMSTWVCINIWVYTKYVWKSKIHIILRDVATCLCIHILEVKKKVASSTLLKLPSKQLGVTLDKYYFTTKYNWPKKYH